MMHRTSSCSHSIVGISALVCFTKGVQQLPPSFYKHHLSAPVQGWRHDQADQLTHARACIIFQNGKILIDLGNALASGVVGDDIDGVVREVR